MEIFQSKVSHIRETGHELYISELSHGSVDHCVCLECLFSSCPNVPTSKLVDLFSRGTTEELCCIAAFAVTNVGTCLNPTMADTIVMLSGFVTERLWDSLISLVFRSCVYATSLIPLINRVLRLVECDCCIMPNPAVLNSACCPTVDTIFDLLLKGDDLLSLVACLLLELSSFPTLMQCPCELLSDTLTFLIGVLHSRSFTCSSARLYTPMVNIVGACGQILLKCLNSYKTSYAISISGSGVGSGCRAFSFGMVHLTILVLCYRTALYVSVYCTKVCALTAEVTIAKEDWTLLYSTLMEWLPQFCSCILYFCKNCLHTHQVVRCHGQPLVELQQQFRHNDSELKQIHKRVEAQDCHVLSISRQAYCHAVCVCVRAVTGMIETVTDSELCSKYGYSSASTASLVEQCNALYLYRHETSKCVSTFNNGPSADPSTDPDSCVALTRSLTAAKGLNLLAKLFDLYVDVDGGVFDEQIGGDPHNHANPAPRPSVAMGVHAPYTYAGGAGVTMNGEGVGGGHGRSTLCGMCSRLRCIAVTNEGPLSLPLPCQHTNISSLQQMQMSFLRLFMILVQLSAANCIGPHYLTVAVRHSDHSKPKVSMVDGVGNFSRQMYCTFCDYFFEMKIKTSVCAMETLFVLLYQYLEHTSTASLLTAGQYYINNFCSRFCSCSARDTFEIILEMEPMRLLLILSICFYLSTRLSTTLIQGSAASTSYVEKVAYDTDGGSLLDQFKYIGSLLVAAVVKVVSALSWTQNRTNNGHLSENGRASIVVFLLAAEVMYSSRRNVEVDGLSIVTTNVTDDDVLLLVQYFRHHRFFTGIGVGGDGWIAQKVLLNVLNLFSPYYMMGAHGRRVMLKLHRSPLLLKDIFIAVCALRSESVCVVCDELLGALCSPTSTSAMRTVGPFQQFLVTAFGQSQQCGLVVNNFFPEPQELCHSVLRQLEIHMLQGGASNTLDLLVTSTLVLCMKLHWLHTVVWMVDGFGNSGSLRNYEPISILVLEQFLLAIPNIMMLFPQNPSSLPELCDRGLVWLKLVMFPVFKCLADAAGSQSLISVPSVSFCVFVISVTVYKSRFDEHHWSCNCGCQLALRLSISDTFVQLRTLHTGEEFPTVFAANHNFIPLAEDTPVVAEEDENEGAAVICDYLELYTVVEEQVVAAYVVLRSMLQVIVGASHGAHETIQFSLVVKLLQFICYKSMNIVLADSSWVAVQISIFEAMLWVRSKICCLGFVGADGNVLHHHSKPQLRLLCLLRFHNELLSLLTATIIKAGHLPLEGDVQAAPTLVLNVSRFSFYYIGDTLSSVVPSLFPSLKMIAALQCQFIVKPKSLGGKYADFQVDNPVNKRSVGGRMIKPLLQAGILAGEAIILQLCFGEAAEAASANKLLGTGDELASLNCWVDTSLDLLSILLSNVDCHHHHRADLCGHQSCMTSSDNCVADAELESDAGILVGMVYFVQISTAMYRPMLSTTNFSDISKNHLKRTVNMFPLMVVQSLGMLERYMCWPCGNISSSSCQSLVMLTYVGCSVIRLHLSEHNGNGEYNDNGGANDQRILCLPLMRRLLMFCQSYILHYCTTFVGDTAGECSVMSLCYRYLTVVGCRMFCLCFQNFSHKLMGTNEVSITHTTVGGEGKQGTYEWSAKVNRLGKPVKKRKVNFTLPTVVHVYELSSEDMQSLRESNYWVRRVLGAAELLLDTYEESISLLMNVSPFERVPSELNSVSKHSRHYFFVNLMAAQWASGQFPVAAVVNEKLEKFYVLCSITQHCLNSNGGDESNRQPGHR